MLLRRSIAVAAITLAATGVSAAPAFAKAPPKNAPHAAKAAKAAKAHHRKFVLVGTVKAVDASSLTIVVKGGNQRALAGKAQSVTLADGASVRRNDADGPLSSLVAGDHVMVKGLRDGDTFTASKVRAESAEASETPEAPEAHPAS